MLFNEFFLKLPFFLIILILKDGIMEFIGLLIVLIILSLLEEVYLSSNFSQQLAFSSLSFSLGFFDDNRFLVPWVCELPRSVDAGAVKSILFGFSASCRTFV